MLMIRLQRVGKKHEPVFRLVLTESQNAPKSGKFLEILGNYDARKEERGEFKIDRVKHWISMGAQLSTTVHNFLIDKKIIEGKKINALPKKKPIISEKVAETPKTPEVKSEAPVEDAEPKEEKIVEETAIETPAAEIVVDSAESSQLSQDATASEAVEPKEKVAEETPV